MKKSIYLLLLCLLFFSCHSDYKLNGTWLSAYDHTEQDTTFGVSAFLPQDIMTLNDGNYSWTRYSNNGIRSWNGNYKIKSDTLVFDENNKSSFPIYSQNFYALKFQRAGGMIEVYKKVADSLKYNNKRKINLIGNTYILKIENEILDTLIFKNDSIVEWTSGRHRSGSNRWLLTEHGNFKVLFFPFISQSIIYKTESENVHMVFFEENSAKAVMEKLN